MGYFSARTLSAMFESLAGAAAVALAEPADPDHDLRRDAESNAFGQENSFSHNHRKLLEATEFRTVFCKTVSLGGQY